MITPDFSTKRLLRWATLLLGCLLVLYGIYIIANLYAVLVRFGATALLWNTLWSGWSATLFWLGPLLVGALLIGLALSAFRTVRRAAKKSDKDAVEQF